MLKKAHTIQSGDHISFVIGRRVYFDRVCDVRSIRQGVVHVDINDFTGVLVFDEDESVEVAEGASSCA